MHMDNYNDNNKILKACEVDPPTYNYYRLETDLIYMSKIIKN